MFRKRDELCAKDQNTLETRKRKCIFSCAEMCTLKREILEGQTNDKKSGLVLQSYTISMQNKTGIQWTAISQNFQKYLLKSEKISYMYLR